MAEDVKAETGDVVDLTEGSELDSTAATDQAAPVATQSAPTWRKVLGIVLAILAMIVLVLAVEAVWMKTTLEDEEQFVSTLAPIAENEAVAQAVAVRISDGVVGSGEVQEAVSGALPDELSILAVPITGAIGQAVQSVTFEIVQTDAFATAWEAALRTTHTVVSAVVSGNDGALVSEEGVVSIDLNQVAVVVVETVEENRGIDLPEIQADLGSIVLLESDQLATVQDVFGVISTLAWFLPLVGLLLVIGAIWAHPDNRWMVAFLAFGTAVAGLLALGALRFFESTLLGNLGNAIERDAIDAVFDALAAGLRAAMWALIVLALIIGFFAWANGPSSRAQSLRTSVTGTVDSMRKDPDADPGGFASFLAEWKRTIQVIAVLLGFAYLLFGPLPSGVSVLLTAVVVIGVVLFVEAFAGAAEPVAEG